MPAGSVGETAAVLWEGFNCKCKGAVKHHAHVMLAAAS